MSDTGSAGPASPRRTDEQPATGEDDELLAELLGEMLVLPAAESLRVLAARCSEHPHLSDELRALWSTAQVAEDAGVLHRHLPPPVDSADDQAPLQIGDYELQEELGRGGMGVVYRAWQGSLERTVALKMIPNAAYAAEQDLQRLRAEALAAARLNHPNIVPVYEVGEFRGHPWFSMQYLDGTTLSQQLLSGPLNAEHAVSLLLPIVNAIHAAHRSGVLHRDLKPSNILITADGKPFVTDFGLAKRVALPDAAGGEPGSGSDVANLTQSGAILGTPAWMSPEQAAGQNAQIDVTSDVYSLGAVLYAMLTGRPPFQAASPLDTMLMVMEQDPPAIRVLNPAVDADLEMIILKCLQKPADLRYQTAAALEEDLVAWQHQQPIAARRSTIAQVMTRLFRESHHAVVLQNWGLLWMWHSLVLLVLCLVTNGFQWLGFEERWPYVSLWVVGLGLWALIFWNLRHRSGPITAVERHIAHVWAGSMIASSMLFAVESVMGLKVLSFSPVLGSIAGCVFLVKAGMLSGSFYFHAAALFGTSLVMAAIQQSSLPNFSISLFGVVSALTFFLPGLKYYRRRIGQSGNI